MPPPGDPNPPARRPAGRVLPILLGFTLLVAAAGVAGRFLPDRLAAEVDFVEYAAAARLLLAGDNPYDAAKLLPIQRAAGWPDDKAQMMWNPPWVFPVVLPTGLVPWASAYLAWDAAQLLAVVSGCVLAWRAFGGAGRLAWVAAAMAVLFAPTVFLLKLGQISGFMVLGLGGFAAAMRAGRPGLAGAAAALTAVKPHLLLPFAALLACDALVSPMTRRAVLAGAAVLGLAAAFPLAWNPDVWRQYVEATRAPSDEFHHAPSAWAPPILASKLAGAVNGGLAVQFAPSVVFTAAAVGYWAGRRRDWSWPRELPWVVLGSYLTTGYGAWGFDAVVLLLPLVQAAVWLTQGPGERAALWGAVAFGGFSAAVLTGWLPVLWWAPVVAVGWVAAAVLTRPPARTDPAPASPG